jgi:hypothetical protein
MVTHAHAHTRTNTRTNTRTHIILPVVGAEALRCSGRTGTFEKPES